MKAGVEEVSIFHIKTLSAYFCDRMPKLENKHLSSLCRFDQRVEEKESVGEEIGASVSG